MLHMQNLKYVKISFKFNLKYKPKSFNTSKNLIRINCKMFFIFFLLTTTLKNTHNIQFNVFKKTKRKWSFPRAPYKNKLSQVTIGDVNYFFYIHLQLPAPLIFQRNVINTSSLLFSFFLSINSPLLHTTRYCLTLPCVFLFEL